MHDRRRGFWFWPGWRQLGFAVLLGLAEAALFVVTYGGAAWIAHRHSYRVHIHTDVDLAIPLLPEAAVAYLSLNALFCIAPFVLRTRRELAAYVAALAVATVTAGVFFVVLPIADAFESPSDELLGRWRGVFHLASAIASRHNFLPSLHVAFTTICVLIYSASAGKLGRVLLATWGATIVASTLLIHQHYVVDVITGLLLGWGSLHLVYWPRLESKRVPRTETLPANAYREPERWA